MKYFVIALLVASMVLPQKSLARHERSSERSDSWGVDRDELADDVVEEIPIPVLFGITYKNVRTDFGDSRGGGTRMHEGQDLFAKEGTPIVSPTKAIVIRTGEGDSAGNYIYTANPGGETFRYMHLKDVANLDPGDELEVGDYLGTVGNTGNATSTPHHLHFEMRDEDNEAQDPYPRLQGEAFSLKQKMSFLKDIFAKRRDDKAYAKFLVDTYLIEFKTALKEGYVLPEVVEDALADKGIVSAVTAEEQLTQLIASIPTVLKGELTQGNSGASVTLLQLYLIYGTTGNARNVLAQAGPTGYFGPATAAALKEYQNKYAVAASGVYDAKTRSVMIDNSDITLTLK